MKYSYIKYFPKPFLDDLVQNRTIPIVGAGFSKNADLPTNKVMPNWEELGKEFSNLIDGYSYSGALDALSAFEHEYSRTKLIEKLSEELLINVAKPGSAHKTFCELPFELVCTTNLEFLLEKGYELTSRYCRPLIEEDQLSIANVNQGVSLLKFHGDLHHPKRMIVTEEDYDSFLDRYPLLSTFIANLLISKTAFFIGYSLDDPDFRQIWQLVGDRLGKLRRQAYTLRVDAKPNEISRFERRGVKVINIPGKASDYPVILESVFTELKEYWSEEFLKYSTITQEESLIELSLPPNTSNRLCFISIPFNLLSFYKKYVFPVIRNHGFVPITADEVLTPGDSILPKISALIDRSALMIVDLTSSYASIEMGMAISKLKKENILILKESGSTLPSDLESVLYFERPKNPFDQIPEIVQTIDSWISNKAGLFYEAQQSEAIRLLEKGEFRAAVISAIIELEHTIRALFEEIGSREDYIYKRIPSMISLVDWAFKKQIIDQREYALTRDFLPIRNRLVHTTDTISSKEARKIVTETVKITDRIKSQKS